MFVLRRRGWLDPCEDGFCVEAYDLKDVRQQIWLTHVCFSMSKLKPMHATSLLLELVRF